MTVSIKPSPLAVTADTGLPLPMTCLDPAVIISSIAKLAKLSEPAAVCNLPTACNISVKSRKAFNSSGSKIAFHIFAFLPTTFASLTFLASVANSSACGGIKLPNASYLSCCAGKALLGDLIPSARKYAFGSPKGFLVCTIISSHTVDNQVPFKFCQAVAPSSVLCKIFLSSVTCFGFISPLKNLLVSWAALCPPKSTTLANCPAIVFSNSCATPVASL